jgi:hypothetical protein
MKSTFTVECQDIFDFNETKGPGKQQVEHIESRLFLKVGFPLDMSRYYGEDNRLNVDGCEVATRVLLNGIMGNLHYMHQRGFRDSAEHFRYLIAEMEKLFIHVVETDK